MRSRAKDARGGAEGTAIGALAESNELGATGRLFRLLLTCAAGALLPPPASTQDPQLFGIQKTMVEAWTIVTEAYVDDSFNHTGVGVGGGMVGLVTQMHHRRGGQHNVHPSVCQPASQLPIPPAPPHLAHIPPNPHLSTSPAEWDHELADALGAVAAAHSSDEARAQIPALLGKLGDPFTRWLPPKQYQEFRIGNEGQLQGVGMLIAADPESGRMVVLAPIQGSPADEAGIQPGDEVGAG